MKLYRFALLFFDGTVITGKFCVGVPLNIQSIFLSIYFVNTRDLNFLNVRSHKFLACLPIYITPFKTFHDIVKCSVHLSMVLMHYVESTLSFNLYFQPPMLLLCCSVCLRTSLKTIGSVYLWS